VIKSCEEVTIRNWSTALCLKTKACGNVPEINEKTGKRVRLAAMLLGSGMNGVTTWI